MKTGAAWAVVLVLLVTARNAAAAVVTTRPVVEALDVASVPCLDKEALAAQLQAWLRRDQIDNRISIVVRPGPTEAQSETVSFFILRDGKAVVERRLPHVQVGCDQLRAAVGLAIAISVETMLVTVTEEPRSAPEPGPDVAPEKPKPEAAEERRFAFALWALGAPALLPRPAFGLSPMLSVRLGGSFEMDASILGTYPVEVQVGSGTGDLSLIAGRLEGCVARYRNVLGSRACLGAAMGRLVADGTGYAQSYAPRLTWAGATATLEATLKVASGFRLALGMDGILPLIVPRLVVLSPQGDVVAATSLPQFGAMFFGGPQVDF
jgi:hypothetical protein